MTFSDEGEDNNHGQQAIEDNVEEKVNIVKEKKMNLKSLEMFPSLGGVNKESEAVPVQTQSKWSGAVAVRSSNITQVFQLAAEHQRKHKEPINLSELCSCIGKETGTNIDASRSGQSQALTFVIRGCEEDIAVARRRLWSHLAESVTILIDVPEECLGLIIGPGGRKLQALMAETSTRINIAKPYDGHVSIAGVFEGISMAKQRIEAIIHDKVSKSSSVVVLQRPYLPFVFQSSTSGKVQDMVKTFADEWQVRIVVGHSGSASEMSLNVSGDRKLVAATISELEKRVEEAKRAVKNVSTQVPKALHRFLVGSHGGTLHGIEEATGCFITVPGSEDASETITVYGPEKVLLQGLQMVLEKTSAIDIQKISVKDPRVKELFLHRNRPHLREWESKYDVHIHPTDEGFSVDGKKAGVAMAVMEFTNTLTPLNSYVFENVPIDAAYLKHVIGKKGQNMHQVQSEFGVELVILDQEDTICIAGPTTANVAKAREHLIKKIADLSDLKRIEIPVDVKFHKQIIGSKGGNINKYLETYPNVLIDLKENGTVVIRGPSKEVAAANMDLLKEIEDIKHEFVLNSYTSEVSLTEETLKAATDAHGNISKNVSFIARDHNVKVSLSGENLIVIQGVKAKVDSFKPILQQKLVEIADRVSETMQVPHEMHAVLIGKGGKNVKDLQQKYDLRIQFPEVEDVENSTVTLTCPKANMKAAREEVLEFLEYEKSHRHVDTLIVPDLAIPAILGKAGAIIKELRLETDTRIDVDKELLEGGDRRVIIEGTVEGVAVAKQRIMALVEERMSLSSIVVNANESQFKSIMGPGIAVYKALTSKYEPLGVQVYAERDRHEFTIRGQGDKVVEASKELNDLINSSEEFIAASVEIPAKHHGLIIGSKGENIRKICEQHLVAVSFPGGRRSSETGNPNMVNIEGRSGDVEAVKVIILGYIRESAIVSMPRILCGDVVKKMRKEMENLKIQMSDSPDGLTITGPPSSLPDAVKRIKEELKAIEASLVVATIPVPQSMHRLIIGKGGNTIETLREETGCRIYVPSAKDSSTDIELAGTEESVSKAKEAIASIVSKSH